MSSYCFNRINRHLDIATGTVPLTDSYQIVGSSTVWHIKNKRPPFAKSHCYLRAKSFTCTQEQWEKVVSGEAEIKNWQVVGLNGLGDIDPELGNRDDYYSLEAGDRLIDFESDSSLDLAFGSNAHAEIDDNDAVKDMAASEDKTTSHHPAQQQQQHHRGQVVLDGSNL